MKKESLIIALSLLASGCTKEIITKRECNYGVINVNNYTASNYRVILDKDSVSSYFVSQHDSTLVIDSLIEGHYTIGFIKLPTDSFHTQYMVDADVIANDTLNFDITNR